MLLSRRRLWSVVLALGLSLPSAAPASWAQVAQAPALGALDGTLVRNAAQPLVANGEYLDTAPSYAPYEKVGPMAIVKLGPGDYRAWAEMVSLAPDRGGPRTYGQAGPRDGDTTTGFLTSTDGTTWTWYDANRDGNPDRLVTPFTATNPPGGATDWMHGEASVGTVLYDPAVARWKLWGHAGNNSGPRAIYSAESADGITWVLQNAGQPVLRGSGAPGRFDEVWVSDARVVRLSPTRYLMLYRGQPAQGGPQIGAATSTDGIAWTRVGTTPVVGYGSGWDAGAIYPGGLLYDGTMYHLWYGGSTADDGGQGLGYASSPDGHTWSRGSLNPVLALSTSGLDRRNVGDTVWAYLDGLTARIQYGSELDVPNGGNGYFRGRLEASITAPPAPASSPTPTPTPTPPTATPGPDRPPVAALAVGCDGLVCTLDASASSDDRGIAAYSWDCGAVPNCAGTGAGVRFTYPHPGRRTAVVTVTDTAGQTATASVTFDVGGTATPIGGATPVGDVTYGGAASPSPTATATLRPPIEPLPSPTPTSSRGVAH